MQTYKAISLLEPWATLLASGKKKIETRGKDWPYRGMVAIHASARIDPMWRRIVDGELLCEEAKYYIDALRSLGIRNHKDLPRGCVLGLGEIIASYQYTVRTPRPPYPERAFGDYADGRWGLIFKNARLLRTPPPAKGMLGLWTWTPEAPLEFLDAGAAPAPYLPPRDIMADPQLALF